MTVTDEMVKLAYDALQGRGAIPTREAVTAALEAALSALPKGEAVVKPLEWTEIVQDAWWLADHYRIEKAEGERFATRAILPGSMTYKTIAFGVSFEAAKSAAQTDYEQRIRSALVATPQPAVPECPWQDMSTAPKDGTMVDLHVGYSRVADAWYHHSGKWVFIAVGGLTKVPGTPTHWMPRPAAPKGAVRP